MLIEKIRRGVLQVTTDAGTHYVQPSLLEKLLLLWTFRNFRVLPEEVLTQQERQLVKELCSQRRLQESLPQDVTEPSCVIGIVDRVPPAPKKIMQKARKAAQGVSA
jgi:hypothetical protein